MSTTPDTGGWDDEDDEPTKATPEELDERLRQLEGKDPIASTPGSNKSAFAMAGLGAAGLAVLLFFGNFFKGCFRIEPRLPEERIVSKLGGEALVTPDRNEQGHATGVMRIGAGAEEVIIQSSRNFLVKNRKDGKIEHPPVINRDTGQRDEYSPGRLHLTGDNQKITFDPNRMKAIEREHDQAKNRAPYTPPPIIVNVVLSGKKAEIGVPKNSARIVLLTHYHDGERAVARSKNDAEITLNLPPDIKLKDARLVVLGEGRARNYAILFGNNEQPAVVFSNFNQNVRVVDSTGKIITLCGKNRAGEEMPLLPSDGFVPLRDTSNNYAIPANVGITLEELLKQEPNRSAALGKLPLNVVSVEESSKLVPLRVNYQGKI